MNSKNHRKKKTDQNPDWVPPGENGRPPVTITFSVEGMTCPSCVRRVEAALSGHKGIDKASVDFGRQEAEIQYDPEELSPDDLKEMVQKQGYRLIQKKYEDRATPGIPSGRWRPLKPSVLGASTGVAVIGFYLGLISLTSDWYNARLEFKHYGPWILALAVGLGLQVALFSFFRIWQRGESLKRARYTLAASGGLSTTAMAACCSHYLAVFLPVLGLPFLSAGVAGLADYQIYFFLIGILSNLFGIGYLLRVMIRSGMIPLKAKAVVAHCS